MESKATEARSNVRVSRGFGEWLARTGVSLAFTSYQSGQLFLIGRLPGDRISVNQQNHSRAMGIAATPQRLYLGTLHQIVRLENVLRPGELANQDFDRLFVPRNIHVTGDIDVHELGIDRTGRVIFVSSKYSCLATTSSTHGFRPVWKPDFISRLAAEDRCHLNGLAMQEGMPAYVTACSRSDMLDGWRGRRGDGGVLIEVASGRVVTEGLSMPHSPRVADDGLWLLDSGRGQVVRVDPDTGTREDVAFCPGFLRGMALLPGHVVVTLSLPRDGSFAGLALDDALKARDGEPWCGLCVIDRRNGDIVEWLRIEGGVRELFDVAVIAGAACPMAIGVDSAEARSLITFDEDFAPLVIEDQSRRT